jgi:ketosteroid isomerase-like protein
MIRLKISALIALIVGFNLLGLQGQQAQTENDAAQNEIKSLEAQNASSTDAHVLANLIADDYVMIGLDGSTSSKAQVVNAESGTNKPQITLHIQQITHFQGTAVVVGGATISSQQPGGHSLAVEANYSNVWMKRGGNWQLVSSHMSPLHPVPAELCLNQRSTAAP